MRLKAVMGAGFTAAVLAVIAMQLPHAALALNPQPEVPSKPNPNLHKKAKKSGKTKKHLPAGKVKR
jgi:hypothetical protein